MFMDTAKKDINKLIYASLWMHLKTVWSSRFEKADTAHLSISLSFATVYEFNPHCKQALFTLSCTSNLWLTTTVPTVWAAIYKMYQEVLLYDNFSKVCYYV